MNAETKRTMISRVRGVGVALAVLAAVYPLPDGNLLGRAVMAGTPLAAAFALAWLLNKLIK